MRGHVARRFAAIGIGGEEGADVVGHGDETFDAHAAAVHLAERQVKMQAAPDRPATDAIAVSRTTTLPSVRPEISVIICSIDPERFAAVSANYAERLEGARYEIVGIHDARSLAEGYNRAIKRSRGDIVILSHDDVEILTRDFAPRLKAHLARHDLVGPCGTSKLTLGHWMKAGWPYRHGLVAHQFPSGHPEQGIFRVLVCDGSADAATGGLQALDGMFIAAQRGVLEALRFDEETFDGFHLYDLDLTFAAHLAGRDVAAFRDIAMVHYTTGGAADYEQDFTRYRLRFEAKYAGRLSATPSAAIPFLQVRFERKEQVRVFCESLLDFRRSSLSAR